MKKRKEFLKLVDDCEKGKIDLVITKSTTRFARNTLEGIQIVRQLKRLGVGVFFEKENANTLYMDNEMILTFFFSQAQAESESLSKNVSWGHRRNYENGKVYYHYGSDWYYTYDDNYAGYWYEASSFPESNYNDYALGEDWSSDWGVSNFKNSSTWDAIQESHSSSSSDYDSWDSGDTDWDSDW